MPVSFMTVSYVPDNHGLSVRAMIDRVFYYVILKLNAIIY